MGSRGRGKPPQTHSKVGHHFTHDPFVVDVAAVMSAEYVQQPSPTSFGNMRALWRSSVLARALYSVGLEDGEAASQDGGRLQSGGILTDYTSGGVPRGAGFARYTARWPISPQHHDSIKTDVVYKLLIDPAVVRQLIFDTTYVEREPTAQGSTLDTAAGLLSLAVGLEPGRYAGSPAEFMGIEDGLRAYTAGGRSVFVEQAAKPLGPQDKRSVLTTFAIAGGEADARRIVREGIPMGRYRELESHPRAVYFSHLDDYPERRADIAQVAAAAALTLI